MRIGINASFLRKPATGIGQVTLHFLRELIARQTEESIVLRNEYILFLEEEIDPKLELDLPENFSVVVSLPPYKRDDLIRKIWWEKFTLFNLMHQYKCEKFLSLYQSATLSSPDISHTMVVHDLIPLLFPAYMRNSRQKLYQGFIKKAIQKVPRIISVSEHTKNDLVQLLDVPEQRVDVNLIGVDPIFREIPSATHTKTVLERLGVTGPYIYTGGGLEVRKNVESTILAYKDILDQELQSQNRLQTNSSQVSIDTFPQLVISGRLMPQLVPLACDVESLVKELGIEKYVCILGFVESVDLPALYSGAEFFVFPSHYEGFGMPVLEAFSMSTAVLTAHNSSLIELGNDAVAYCDSYSVSDIATKMRELVENPDLRSQLGEKGLQRSKDFSWESFVYDTMKTVMR